MAYEPTTSKDGIVHIPYRRKVVWIIVLLWIGVGATVVTTTPPFHGRVGVSGRHTLVLSVGRVGGQQEILRRLGGGSCGWTDELIGGRDTARLVDSGRWQQGSNAFQNAFQNYGRNGVNLELIRSPQVAGRPMNG